jgi:HEPN domain-containing protein
MSTEADLARGWLVKAASDLGTARLVVDGDGPYDTACFHAQQAREKSLKGFLAFHRQPIPRTHDLEDLQQLCLTACLCPTWLFWT